MHLATMTDASFDTGGSAREREAHKRTRREIEIDVHLGAECGEAMNVFIAPKQHSSVPGHG